MPPEAGHRRGATASIALAGLFGLAGLILGAAAAAGVLLLGGRPKLDLGASHHAVLLSNGQAFFGRLEERGADVLVLTDAFYIQAQRGADGKETSNRLVRRGAEPHGPTRMYIPARNVQFIEPVAPESQIGKLIAEAKR